MVASAVACQGQSDGAHAVERTMSTASFRQRAHRTALERARNDATSLFAVLDPIAAAQLGDVAPQLTPVGVHRLDPLRPQLDALWTDLIDIDESLIAPQKRAHLRLLRFAVNRARDRSFRRRWEREDPSVLVAQTTAAVEEIETRLLSDESCEHCAQGLEACAEAVPLMAREMGAASVPAMEAAFDALPMLIDRVGVLARADPTLRPGATALIASLRAVHSSWQTLVPELLQAPVLEYGKAVVPLFAGGALHRLPDAMGWPEIRRMLEVSESIGWPLEQLLSRQQATIVRLTMLLEPVRHGTDKRIGMSQSRCSEHWNALQPSLPAQLAPHARLNCAVATALWPSELSDDELDTRLAVLGAVVPAMRQRLRTQPRWLAIVHGDTARVGHRSALAASWFLTQRLPGPARLQLTQARREACLAYATLIEHGGDEAHKHESSFVKLCGDVDESLAGLRARARAWPRLGLRGLGHIAVGGSPEDASALAEFWWAPQGTIGMLAHPTTLVKPLPQEDTLHKISL